MSEVKYVAVCENCGREISLIGEVKPTRSFTCWVCPYCDYIEFGIVEDLINRGVLRRK